MGVLREALRQDHQGDIRVIHLAHEAEGHYLAEPLAALAARHGNLTVELWTAAQLQPALAQLRLVSRHTLALLCGHPASVEAFSKRLFLAGLPRNQLLADVFLSRLSLYEKPAQVGIGVYRRVLMTPSQASQLPQ